MSFENKLTRRLARGKLQRIMQMIRAGAASGCQHGSLGQTIKSLTEQIQDVKHLLVKLVGKEMCERSVLLTWDYMCQKKEKHG